MKALLLNGPPRSGKDTIGRMLWSHMPDQLVCVKFAAPIVSFMLREFSVDLERCEKDEIRKDLRGRTAREVAIAYSELFCKPLFGRDHFGHEAVVTAQRMERIGMGLCVFTDSGFVQEVQPLLEHLGRGNLLQVRLTRPGCNFDRDSRSYWGHDAIGQIVFDNDCLTVNDLREKVKSVLVPEVLAWLR